MFDSKAGVSPSPGLAVHSGTKHMVEAVAEAVRQEVSWHPWLHPCGRVFWIYIAKLLDLSGTGEGVRGEGGHCETGRNCHSRLWPCGWQQSEQARLSFSCCCHNYCLLLSQICCCWCHSHCYCYCDHHHHQDQCSREVAAGLGCWVPADTSGCLRPEVVAAQVSFDASKGSTRMSFLYMTIFCIEFTCGLFEITIPHLGGEHGAGSRRWSRLDGNQPHQRLVWFLSLRCNEILLLSNW